MEQRVAAAAVRMELQIEEQMPSSAMNPRRCGAVFTIDGKQYWRIRNHLSLNVPDLLASLWKQFSRLIDRAENPELERLQFLSIVSGHVKKLPENHHRRKRPRQVNLPAQRQPSTV